MKHLLVASAFALTAATGAHGAEGQKFSQADCDVPTNAEKISESAAGAYITDIKAANPDGDTTIEKDEFDNACAQGMIKSSAATAGTSDRRDGK